MSIYVVDASVAAKWFTDEEHGEAALSLLDKKNRLHAPDFLLLEMDSIIGKWARRGTVSPAEGEEIRDALRSYPIQMHPFTLVLDTAFAIAGQTGQSIYDCLYVALAAILKGRMVTADYRLYQGLKDGPLAKHVVWVGDL